MAHESAESAGARRAARSIVAGQFDKFSRAALHAAPDHARSTAKRVTRWTGSLSLASCFFRARGFLDRTQYATDCAEHQLERSRSETPGRAPRPDHVAGD